MVLKMTGNIMQKSQLGINNSVQGRKRIYVRDNICKESKMPMIFKLGGVTANVNKEIWRNML